jgi:hypothetical protein
MTYGLFKSAFIGVMSLTITSIIFRCVLFKEAICHKCNKKGHIKKACKGKKISDTRKLHLLGDNEDDESDSYGIYSVSKKAKDAIIII